MNVDFTYDLRLSASVVLLCNALEIMGHRRSTPQKPSIVNASLSFSLGFFDFPLRVEPDPNHAP